MEVNAVSKSWAFVLGGGGARGALQAGALRALFECGYMPEMLVGTSAGAINATFISLYGSSLETVGRLETAWRQAAELDLLPANYVWSTLRSMLRPSKPSPAHRIRDFFLTNGISPDVRFSDIQGPKLFIVSSDLNTGKPVLHGTDPSDSILDALLVSTALPPWAMPVRRQDRYLMDGGVVSSLPIEPAVAASAKQILALDLSDPRDAHGPANGFGVFLNKLTYAIEQRQIDLELELAKARGVPVFHIRLMGSQVVPLWDFHHTDELIVRGYEITQQALTELPGRELRPQNSIPA